MIKYKFERRGFVKAISVKQKLFLNHLDVFLYKTDYSAEELEECLISSYFL